MLNNEIIKELKRKSDFIHLLDNAIAHNVSDVESVEYVAFENLEWKNAYYEYLVVTFRGGAISVRNIHMNSNLANFEELAKLLGGGYYSEVNDYKDLLVNEKIRKVVF